MGNKLQLLTTLKDMKKRCPTLPCILGGDFNITKSLMEKKGGTRTLGRDSIAFQNFITNMKLVDMETINGIFTWNKKEGAVPKSPPNWTDFLFHSNFFSWEAALLHSYYLLGV